MLLTVTEAGRRREDDALFNGIPMPPITAIVVGDGALAVPAKATRLANRKLALSTLVVDRLSPGVTKIHGEISPDIEVNITEIGLELADGTLYAAAQYSPETGGQYKGRGFSFSFFVLVSRDTDTPLRFEYVPVDVQALGAQIQQEARTQLDLYLNQFLLATARTLSGLNGEILHLTNRINHLKPPTA